MSDMRNNRRRGRIGKLAFREMMFGYAGLTPYVLGFLVFSIGPLIYSLWLCTQRYTILEPPTWVGWANIAKLGRDPLFWKSLKNTTTYSVVSIPLQVLVGYSLALLLNQKVLGLSFWRTLFYVPSIVPTMASAYLFVWIFNPQVGLANGLLKGIGIIGPNWFGDPNWALRTFIIMSLWGTGGGMLLYLAALQQVPTDLYDAAKVDGAGAWHRLLNVTLPMTSPVILFMLIMGIIDSFQIFTTAFIITGGGPVNATLMYVLYLYQVGWSERQMGYASALAWVLFLVIMALTLLTFRVTRRLVYYEVGERGA
ncbi:MAG: sugar ABC transporter permease [Chloroflexi bacterium]|nr:sugar ABC transporter permease [Chloroflexota bacterium]